MGTYFITYEFKSRRVNIEFAFDDSGYAVLEVDDIKDIDSLKKSLIEYQKTKALDIHKPWYITKITLINKL